VQQVQRAGDVRIDHVLDVLEILFQECLAQPVASVGEQRVHRPLRDQLHQAFDALLARQFALHRLDGGAERAAILGCLFQRLVGREHQIEAVLGTALGQVESDAG
jgi:hypothetical protein